MASTDTSHYTAYDPDELHMGSGTASLPSNDDPFHMGMNGSAGQTHEDIREHWRPGQNGTATGHNNANGAASVSQARARRNIFNEAAGLVNAGGLGHARNPSAPLPPRSEEITSALTAYERAFQPRQPKSLSGIALRSFLLGLVLAISTTLTLYLAYNDYALWRASFFLATLCTFHFLEFYTTALSNTAAAKVSSFLLASNGSAYTIAHTAAFVECIFAPLLLPRQFLPTYIHNAILLSGFILVILGQTIRAIAMLQAGANFSHVVAHTKKQEHQLVTDGLYSVLRHPSYFGYFWWAVGTQMVCGNAICFLGYTAVLWIFFSRRINGEEELLVKFFGQEYVRYRSRTWVGIPCIR